MSKRRWVVMAAVGWGVAALGWLGLFFAWKVAPVAHWPMMLGM